MKNYTSFKALNPKLPFLLRPAQGIEPYVLAEYGASPRRARARAATRPLTRARVRAPRPAPGHGHVEQRDLANLTPNEIDETVTRARSRAARAPAPSSDRRFCRSLSVSPRAARVLRSSRSSWRSRRSSPSRGTRARTCRRRSWRRTTSARTRRARCRRRSNRRRRPVAPGRPCPPPGCISGDLRRNLSARPRKQCRRAVPVDRKNNPLLVTRRRIFAYLSPPPPPPLSARAPPQGTYTPRPTPRPSSNRPTWRRCRRGCCPRSCSSPSA